MLRLPAVSYYRNCLPWDAWGIPRAVRLLHGRHLLPDAQLAFLKLLLRIKRLGHLATKRQGEDYDEDKEKITRRRLDVKNTSDDCDDGGNKHQSSDPGPIVL